jgi:hypothetical protein
MAKIEFDEFKSNLIMRIKSYKTNATGQSRKSDI